MALRLPPLSSRQKLALAVIATIAAVLRLESLGETSLAHFDEGVLAANAINVWQQGLLKFQLALPLQAPPLFPWLVAAAHELLASEWIILGKIVSAGLAVATVPIVFLLGRRLQCNSFGLAAAALMAASDLHVAYSRMALTDAPLTFFFTLAMYCVLRLFGAASGPDGNRSLAQRVPLAQPVPPRRVPLAQPVPPRRRPGSLRPLVGWMLATGLAAGAAWTTKYNGWMSLAAAGTALGLVWLRDLLAPAKPRALADVARWRLAVALAGAAIVAGLCFAPWVWFVDRAFAGGYAAVTANHWSYFGGPAAWPGRAWRLWTSLPAFRHYGWLLSLAALAIVLARRAMLAKDSLKVEAAPRFDSRIVGARTVGVATAAAGLFAALALGADTVLLLLAVAAIGPALAYGRFEHVLLAVWLGAFVVMIPFYHPYTRLLTPALPAAILLALWCIDEGWRVLRFEAGAAIIEPLEPPLGSRLCRALTGAAIVASLAFFLAAHPFGWLPSAGLWGRWSTRESYRAFGLAIDEHTPRDAFVLCQALPPMPLYCPREFLPIDRVPFTELLTRAPADQPCFLAVDDWGAYGAGHDDARKALLDNKPCLQIVARTPNDLNIVALLDNLSPDEVAAKLAAERPAGENFLPPALQEMQQDVIVLYRIDRGCVDSQPDP